MRRPPCTGLFLACAALVACRVSTTVGRQGAHAVRPPIIAANDSSWARLDRPCSAAAPIRLAPERPVPATGRPPTDDAETAALSRELPGGYGGLYLGYEPPPAPGQRPRLGSRHVVVLLVDTAQREAALSALAPVIQQGRPDLDVLHARIQAARWSFAELYDWYGALLPRLSRRGVTTIDIDERDNRIMFGVVDRAARQRLEEELARLQPPCFLVGIEVVGGIILQ